MMSCRTFLALSILTTCGLSAALWLNKDNGEEENTHSRYLDTNERKAMEWDNDIFLDNLEKTNYNDEHYPTDSKPNDVQQDDLKYSPQQAFHQYQQTHFKQDVTSGQHIALHNTESRSNKLNCSFTGTNASCRSKGLSSIPTDLRVDITSLDLSINAIKEVPDNVLSRYSQLLSLNLSMNSIQKLSPYSFNGLSQLRFLSLWSNQLLYQNNNFPELVFNPLTKLKTLILSRNNKHWRKKGLTYPDMALAKLTTVESLYLDGLYNPVFGIGFRNMTSLRKLSCMGYYMGYSRMVRLRKESFENLRGLTHLNLRDSNIIGQFIDPEAFSPLTSLKYLNIQHNEDINMINLDKIFHGLRNAKNLTYLDLHLVNDRYSLGICLDSFVIRNIPRSVKTLNAQENSLQAVDRHVIDSLPPGLEVLDISGNPFVFGTYLQDLHKMKSLKHITLSGQSYVYEIPNHYPFDHQNVTMHFTQPLNYCSLYSSQDPLLRSKSFILKFPPKLETINMTDSGLQYILSKWIVHSDNIVREIYISNNTFPKLLGPIIGFTKLRKLDVSYCSVRVVMQRFFSGLVSLKWLNLKGNILGPFLKSAYKPFSPLKYLTHLDLSRNFIDVMNDNVFSGLASLEKLILDYNPIRVFNVKISHMDRLRFLSLVKTQLATLSELTRKQIDSILSSNIQVRVDMRHTPISCVCENLPFLKWMSRSLAFHPKFNPKFKNYSCSYPDSTLRLLPDGYNTTVRDLTGECTDHSLEFFIVAGVSVLFLIILISMICYQFRWTLRYLYYVAYLHFKTSPDNKGNEFEFDAFICYAGEDDPFVFQNVEPELKSRNLRVLVHERDFSAGDYIASNIVRAIRESKKTLVILTKAMLKSKWCNYEIQMANVEARRTGRPVLIFMIKETNPMTVDNVDVFYNIQVNSYCEYPPRGSDQNQIRVFWDKLARDIQQ